MDMNGSLSASDLVIYVISILIALVLHEFMHAFVGFKLGDTTAHEGGRLSLNPLNHIDPFMTVALPIITIILFGVPFLAAKPVPFNPSRLKYDEYGPALVAAAGPLTNLVLAIAAAFTLHSLMPGSFIAHAVVIFTQLNVALFVFNLLPIPPLDGSRVLYAFAPESVQEFMQRMEPYGFFIIFGLIMLPGISGILVNLNQMVLNLLP